MWNEKITKTFSYYYNSLKNGTFVGVKPSEEAKEGIASLVKGLKLKSPIESDKIHITLIYSEGKGDPNFMPYNNIEYEVCATGFALFGEEKNVLVVKVDSPQLQSRHNQLIKNGLKHSYAAYSPHITLSYNFSGDLPNADILEKDGEPLKFVFDQEYVSAIDPNWNS